MRGLELLDGVEDSCDAGVRGALLYNFVPVIKTCLMAFNGKIQLENSSGAGSVGFMELVPVPELAGAGTGRIVSSWCKLG